MTARCAQQWRASVAASVLPALFPPLHCAAQGSREQRLREPTRTVQSTAYSVARWLRDGAVGDDHGLQKLKRMRSTICIVIRILLELLLRMV